MTVGMGASTLATGVWQLGALRAFTGIGIGGMLACVAVIAAEYSTAQWRSTALALQATGYPIGATLGGAIAALLLQHWSWHAVFMLGALGSLLCVPLVLAFLPESLEFLIARRPPNAGARFNAVLARMGMPPQAVLPSPPPHGSDRARGYAALFVPALRRQSLLIALAFFLLMFAFYFVLSWTPKLLVVAGLSAEQGVTGGVLLNLGGIAGGAIFSALAARARLSWLTAGVLGLSALALLAFGWYSTVLGWAFVIAVLSGAVLFAAIAGLYAVAPVVFTAAVRSTGMGWAIGWPLRCDRLAAVRGRAGGCGLVAGGPVPGLQHAAAARGHRRAGHAPAGALNCSAGGRCAARASSTGPKKSCALPITRQTLHRRGGLFRGPFADQRRHAQNHRFRPTPPRHVCLQAAGRVGAPPVLEDLVPGRFGRRGEDPWQPDRATGDRHRAWPGPGHGGAGRARSAA
ncbi:hypothetical protein XPN_2105 [Xanthomonas arboricola pv. pruni MAFF 301427]|nr:hypothetical protein XPN_2105 [Xanthomonas arboricola pv. pruni MAFF 301427]